MQELKEAEGYSIAGLFTLALQVAHLERMLVARHGGPWGLHVPGNPPPPLCRDHFAS